LFKWLQSTPPETLTDIQRAARFFYLQHHAFGGRVENQTFGTATTTSAPSFMRLEENLSTAWMRLAGTFVENLDWQLCIKKYDRPHTFFYLDPPYYETEGYGVDFGFDQYVQMAATLSQIQGKAIVSLNDHPAIRQAFNGFQMDTADIAYNVGGGGNAVDRKELIIYSWDREKEPAGLF
jgi:DNA adenine methylase